MRFRASIALARDAFQKAFQLLAPHWVLQLADGFGFDLADAFARDFKDAAHLLERVGVAVAQAVAQANDFAFAEGQGLEQVLDLLAEHALRGGTQRALRAAVFDELAESAVLAL